MRARILSGAKASPGQFPWQASLQTYDVNQWNNLCGGAIISPDWVLTASHCLHEERWIKQNQSVLVGTLFSTNKNKAGTRHQIAEEIKHVDFRMETYQHDIALLR